MNLVPAADGKTSERRYNPRVCQRTAYRTPEPYDTDADASQGTKNVPCDGGVPITDALVNEPCEKWTPSPKSGRTKSARKNQMAKPNEPYQMVEVESYFPTSTAGLHGPIHIRPTAGQGYPPNLHVECSKTLTNPQIYPVGTKFRIRAKLTDREGDGEFLYSYFGWKPEVLNLSKPKRKS